MKNNVNNKRREFLSTSLKGTLVMGAGLSSVGALLSSFTNAPDAFAATSIDAKTEAEYRMKLAPFAMVSLMSSQVAVDKASNARVKMFATFERDEMMAMTTVLKEMGTPTPPMDAKAQAMMDKMKNASGAEFDNLYMTAQIETHETLRDLTTDYLKNAAGKTSMPEMHGRHIATIALASIKEHTVLSKMIKSELS